MFILTMLMSVLVPVAVFATIAIVGEQRQYRRMERNASALARRKVRVAAKKEERRVVAPFAAVSGAEA